MYGALHKVYLKKIQVYFNEQKKKKKNTLYSTKHKTAKYTPTFFIIRHYI